LIGKLAKRYSDVLDITIERDPKSNRMRRRSVVQGQHQQWMDAPDGNPWR
jgi:hypothetical protein